MDLFVSKPFFTAIVWDFFAWSALNASLAAFVAFAHAAFQIFASARREQFAGWMEKLMEFKEAA